MSTVSVRNLNKYYGGAKALHNINVDINDGNFVVLVGPSGCGKSTLLRTIAGLEHAADGDILIEGKTVTNSLPKDRDIAMVFQNYALYPHMTVRENMGFSLKLRKVEDRKIARKVDETSESLGLTHLLDRFPRQLSGGQRQRVAMGRAIVRNPKVFLFDEPLSNLDAKLRVHMRAEIKALHHRLKTTTVYVTHDQIEAMTLADKIVVMRDGKIEQVGSPLELYDRPANMFVAGFIGSPSMNFLNGTITDEGFRLADGVTLPLESRTISQQGRDAICGVRPEHLEIIEGKPSQGFEIVVEVLEPTGAETQIIGKAAGQPFVGVVKQRVNREPGDRLSVRITGPIHLFDSQTQATI